MFRQLTGAIAALTLSVSAALAQTAAPVTLTLYTSQPQQDAQRTVDAFMAANPGIKVEWVRDGTTQIMARLRAEIAAGTPRADILLIADSVTMETLKGEGRLMAHPQANVAGYADGTHDPQRFWFGTKLITTGIVFNTSAQVRPTTWADLLRPELRGQIVMPSPDVSGAAMIHIATIAQQPGMGWDYFRRLAESRVRPAGGNGPIMQQVSGGQRLYGIVVDFLPIRAKASGAPVEFVFPTEGVSAISEPVAILSTTRQEAAAKRFVDFLISRPGQELASAMGYMPALPGVSPPAGFPAEVKILPFNAAQALRDEAQIRAQIRQIFGE
jgi:iron(III) transport system substrate-binding protein